MPDAITGRAKRSRKLGGHTVWQVKASTLCNLRCRYCYEWDRLGDKHRITLEQWRHVLEAAKDYQRIRAVRHGIESKVFITGHGGEASLLPVDYVEQVLDLEINVLGQDAFDDGTFVNAVQTNLYRINRTLKLMLNRGLELSTSMDLMPGARVNRRGKDAEADALANLEAILAEGWSFGVGLILGRHNHERICDIHDKLEQMGVLWLRLIPMIDPPAVAPSGRLQLSRDETIAALARLLEQRRRNGSSLSMGELERVQATVSRFLHKKAHPYPYHRNRIGDTRLIVHPDGALASQAGITTPQLLGNIFHQTIGEILDSEAYQASLARDAAKRQMHCGNCKYDVYCNQRAVFDEPLGAEGPCQIDAPLCDMLLENVS